MKVLVVGSGGREHALVWRLRLSPRVSDLWTAGGNYGTGQLATNVPVSPDNVDQVAELARSLDIDLVVVGPEQPLTDGLVDRLAALGIPAFGPTQGAAQLEASKSFARRIMQAANVPGPEYRVFRDQSAALDFLRSHSGRVVVKADGLAAGKGVALCANAEEAVIAIKGCMEERIFGPAGDTVVIEEWLEGVEVSVFAFSDGAGISTPIAACDYKQVGAGDSGPNTGGMGSFTPPPFWNQDLAERVCQTIMEPTVAALAERGTPYRGILYAGLMLTGDGPRVLEFNCRFGDPETQVLLPLLESDPVDIMEACIGGSLARTPVRWGNRAQVGVVLASQGYPGKYETGMEIEGLGECAEPTEPAPWDSETLIFHAGSQPVIDGTGRTRAVTSGGRVLTVVGRGETLEEARESAYRKAAQIRFENVYYRPDIGDLSVGSRRGI